MHTTKTIVIACLVTLLAGFWVGRLLKKDSAVDNKATPSPSASASPQAQSSPQQWTMRLTSQGVSPKDLTITAGDAVTFINDTDTAFWPASGPHPTHTLCPGFDSKRGLLRGEEYTLVFSERRTCPYHNHLDNSAQSQRGTITVQ